ncbi:MAG: putative type II secretion system protein F [Pelotomaculum sp. PtaU1.Bin035]|nr:MAG: putative type II secretion system protein F [Pelotomaculum sp. PtaU1.Bin035]
MASQYSYKARNQAGKLFTGKIEAENRHKAIALIRERKFFIVEIKEISSKGISISLDKVFQKKVSSKEMAVMCRQFATMAQAGVPMLQCLNILTQQCDNRILKETLNKITENLEGGMSLTESLKSFSKVFPVIFVNMVESGEVSGALDQVLDRLAVNFQKEHELKEKIKSAMTYPAAVIIVAVLLVAMLLIVVLPRFITLLYDMKAPVPISTQLVIGLSNFLRGSWYMVLILLAGAVTGYKRAVTTERGRMLKDKAVLKLPLFGPMIRKIIISRFCRSLGFLLKSGVPVLQSLDVVKNIAGNYVVTNSIRDAENSIKKGHSISLPLQKSGFFPPMVTRMISIGEETGSVDTLLEKVADFYEREVEELAARLSSLLEPVLIVGMGVVVGFIILSVMLPMFSVINNVK